LIWPSKTGGETSFHWGGRKNYSSHFQFFVCDDDQRNPVTKSNKKMVVKKQANCANCLEVKDRTELLDCARCRSVSYCSKDCQVIHWKKGGHKLLCVAVESSNEVSTTRGGEDDDLRVGFTKRGPRVIGFLIVFIGLTFLLFKLGHLPFGLGHPNVEGQSIVASAPSPTILSPTTSSNKKKEEKIAAVTDSQCKDESKSANYIKKVVDNYGSSVKKGVESNHNNIEHDKKSHISSGSGTMLSNVFERFRRNKNIEGEAPGQPRTGPFKAIRSNFAEKLKSLRQIKPFLPVRNLVKRLKLKQQRV